jgi:hypothetical protein
MPNICTVEHLLQLASGCFAIIAALAWFAAYFVKAPAGIDTTRPVSLNKDVIAPLDKLMKAVARQSKLNGVAAFFAALAALCQTPQAFMPTCWG